MVPEPRRMLEGMHVVPAAPGNPAPEGVPADAIRCEIVLTPRSPPRWRLPILVLGTTLAAGGVTVAALWGPWWGAAPMALGIELLGRLPAAKRLEPARLGSYLAYEAEPRGGTGCMAVGLGTLFIVLAVTAALGLSGPHNWMAQFAMGGCGVAMIRMAILNPAPTLRFRAMADRSYPLSPVLEQPAIEGGASLRREPGYPAVSTSTREPQPR